MAPSSSFLAVLTIARAAALLVLATEGIFLWKRLRRPVSAQGPLGSRFFWAVTPAAILAGLSLWCLASVASRAPVSVAVAARESIGSTD